LDNAFGPNLLPALVLYFSHSGWRGLTIVIRQTVQDPMHSRLFQPFCYHDLIKADPHSHFKEFVSPKSNPRPAITTKS
jgi:hypothetical protein